jgi:hypothetical protein
MNNVLHIALHRTAENEPFSSQNGKFLFHIFWDKNHIGKSNKKSIEKANKVRIYPIESYFIEIETPLSRLLFIKFDLILRNLLFFILFLFLLNKTPISICEPR